MSQFTVGEKVRMVLPHEGKGGRGALVYVAKIKNDKVEVIETDGTWGWKRDGCVPGSYVSQTEKAHFWNVGSAPEGIFEKLEPEVATFELNPGERHPYYNGRWYYSESYFDRISGRIHTSAASQEEQSIIKKTMSLIKQALKTKEQKALEHFDIVNSCGELTQQGKSEMLNFIFEHGAFDKAAFTKVFVDMYEERDTK